MLFGTSNNLMCHIFLILSYVFISCLNHIFLSHYFLLASVQSLSHRQCLLSHPTHHHKCHLLMADPPTTKQNITSHGQSMSPPFWPCCPPATSQFPSTAAMAHGSVNGDGWLQQQQWWQWQWRGRWRWRWWRWRSWRWRWGRQWQWRQPRWGQPLQRKGCLFMWRQCATLLDGQHLASTPMDTKESAITSAASWGWQCKECLLPFKGEGSWQLTMDCILFNFYNYCSVYWTTLCLPPALFRRSRTLSGHWCSTSSTPPRIPSAYWQSTPAPIALFVKVSPSRACNDYNVDFLCWCEMTNLSANFFISKTFALTWIDNTFVILKIPCCDSWDIQGQSLSCGFKAFFCTTLLPGLGACICLATF